MANVTLESDAADQFLRLPTRIKDRIAKLLTRLEKWPAVSGAKPLRGDLAGHYRLRTGDYRLQFRVEKAKGAEGEESAKKSKVVEVVVEKIGHRDGFYED